MIFLVMVGPNSDNPYVYGYVEYPNLQELLNALSAKGYIVLKLPASNPGPQYVECKKVESDLIFFFQQIQKVDLS
jgi:hypothetical protein